jgi:hypothetical protein
MQAMDSRRSGASRERGSAAAAALKRLEAAPGSLITAADVPGATPAAASKALSRLAQQGSIQRVRKGLYYMPKETLLGTSHPSESAVIQKVLGARARPTGLTAANILGMSTQMPAQPEFAVYASAAPKGLHSARIHLRPRSRTEGLEVRDAALLEFLRDRGRYGELSPAETCARARAVLLAELRSACPRRMASLRRLRDAALTEPPRVRAILGALMQSAKLPPALWQPLRDSLNPSSRFDFGLFRELAGAREWQAR